jgi:hypothetical protein
MKVQTVVLDSGAEEKLHAGNSLPMYRSASQGGLPQKERSLSSACELERDLHDRTAEPKEKQLTATA